MPLDKRRIDIPLGGGLAEDVDERLYSPPLVSKAENVKLDKAGNYTKRRGMEALTGVNLPTDTDGVNAPFEYRDGVHLLSARGIYAFGESEDEWRRSRTIDVTPVEAKRVTEIHQAQNLRRFDHATDGTTYICEVWEEQNRDTLGGATNYRVWFQIRDLESGVVLYPARVIDSALTHSPRVVYSEGVFRIWAFDGDPTTTPRSLNEVTFDPATGTQGASTGVTIAYSFDVVAAPDQLSVWGAYMGQAGNNFAFQYTQGAGFAQLTQLADTGTNGAVGVWLGSFDLTVATLTLVGSTGSISVERFGTVGLGSIWAQTNVDSFFPNRSTDFRITCAKTRNDGDIVVAASAAEDVTYDVGPFNLYAAPGQTRSLYREGVASTLRLRLYDINTGAFNSDTFSTWNAQITGHFFRPPNAQPQLPCEHRYERGLGTGGFDYGFRPIPFQRYAYILGIDDETFTIDPQTGLETTTVGCFPVLQSRYNGGAADTPQNEPHAHLSRAYFDPEREHWASISAIIREFRVFNFGWGYKNIAGGRVMGFDYAPGPLTATEVNNLAAINTGYLSSFDGQVQGEMAPVGFPEWVAMRVFETANTDPFWEFASPTDGAELKLAVELEVVDRAGNIHRTGPAAASGGVNGEFFRRAILADTTSSGTPGKLDIELYFTLPDITHYRGQAGLGWRARVYMGVEAILDPGTDNTRVDVSSIVEVAVLPVDLIYLPDNTGTTGYFVGRVLLDENSKTDSFGTMRENARTKGDGAPVGAARWPWDVELLPEKPPPFRDISVVANRLSGISAENPSELWIAKQTRFGRALEFNPALNVISTSDEFTATASMDDKVILFSNDRIYVVPSTAADDTGRGLPPVPQLVATDTGCTNKRSIAEGPFGVMFRGRRGMYILDRSLGLRYAGGPIEDQLRDDSEIWSAVVASNELEVRFTTRSGETMYVYHYNSGQWTTRPFFGHGATTINGRYVYSRNTASGYAVVAERLRTDTDYLDVGSDAGSVSFKNLVLFETAWLKLSGSIQGYKRVYKALLLGEYHDLEGLTPGGLSVEIYYDYDDSAPAETKSFTLGGTGLSAGDPLQIEMRLGRQRAEAIRFRVAEIPAAVVGNVYREGVTLSGITLELGIKRGVFKRPQTRG